jgi:hypothetical protein
MPILMGKLCYGWRLEHEVPLKENSCNRGVWDPVAQSGFCWIRTCAGKKR